VLSKELGRTIMYEEVRGSECFSDSLTSSDSRAFYIMHAGPKPPKSIFFFGWDV
jgi:hypothetical protein